MVFGNNIFIYLSTKPNARWFTRTKRAAANTDINQCVCNKNQIINFKIRQRQRYTYQCQFDTWLIYFWDGFYCNQNAKVQKKPWCNFNLALISNALDLFFFQTQDWLIIFCWFSFSNWNQYVWLISTCFYWQWMNKPNIWFDHKNSVKITT